MILAVSAATAAGIAVGALFVAAAFAGILIRFLDADTERPHSGHGEEFSVEGQPEWWPDFERGFAEYAASARRRGGRS